MASAEEHEGCVTLTWEIENFSLFLATEVGASLDSPVWKVELTGKSEWGSLWATHYESDVLFQVWLEEDSPPCEMSLLSSGNEVLLEKNHKGKSFIKKNQLFGEKRQSILPNDTLTLHCRIWEETIRPQEFCIHSVLNSVNFLWDIENFYSNYTYERYAEQVNFPFYVSLEISENGSHASVTVYVPSAETFISAFVDCSLSIKEGQGRVIAKIPPLFPYVKWECDIEIFSENTSINLQLESVVALHKVYQDQLHSTSKITKHGCSGVLRDDLLHLYREALHTDATLNTEGKSFPVHKSILAARSPVFRAMFEKDGMSEGRSGVVDIDDVDSETVDRMLVFLYGDSFEGVQWEEASALYYAADKYAILPLKQKCAHILKTGLSVDNACNAIALADRHADDHLMKCIVDFIREKEEVIASDNWDNLQNRNPLLAAKILREICMKNKKK